MSTFHLPLCCFEDKKKERRASVERGSRISKTPERRVPEFTDSLAQQERSYVAECSKEASLALAFEFELSFGEYPYAGICYF